MEQQTTFAENRKAALVHLAAAREALARECELTENEAAALRFATSAISWAQGTLTP